MSGHKVPFEFYQSPLMQMPHKATTGTLTIDRMGCVIPVDTTAGAAALTLAQPSKAGIMGSIVLEVDNGDLTLTVTGGYNADATTSITFADAGDFVTFYSIKVGSSYYWRVLSHEGTNVATEDLTVDQLNLLDNGYINFGTGSDRQFTWNGTYLECGPGTGMWANAPSPADPQYPAIAYEVFDHFVDFDQTATAGKWPETVVGTGTQALLDDVAGGVVRLSCQATTDNACEQMTYVSAPFKLAATKTLWYEARVKITGDVQSEHSFGLVALGEDLTAVADVLPADGVSFSTQDGSLAAALTCSKDGTNTGAVAGVHTLVTGTWVTLGFVIDGLTSCTPYVNGVAGTAATATFCDDESLAPYFLVRNGDNVTTQILDINYVRVVQLI